MNYEQQLIDIVRKSPKLMTVLETCRASRIPEWRIVSGAVYGTVFNHLTSRDPDYGIKDYDVAYFDPDTSYDAEDVWIKKIAAALPADLRDLVEVRNQARVHLWFKNRFGCDYEPLKNTDESLERYLCFAHAVAIRLEDDDSISIAAPFGLDDIFNMVMRPNPKRGQTENRIDKVNSTVKRWNEVKVVGMV